MNRTAQKCLHISIPEYRFLATEHNGITIENLTVTSVSYVRNRCRAENRYSLDGYLVFIFFIFQSKLFEVFLCSEMQYGS